MLKVFDCLITTGDGRKENRSILKRGAFFMATAALSAGIMTGTVVSAPAASTPGEAGYEIPLGELHKVKKERPARKSGRGQKAKAAETSPEQKKSSTYQAVMEPEGSAVKPSEYASSTSAVAAGSSPAKAAPFSIHHESYSYLVAGKRALIQAIISGATAPQSVVCRFRSGEKGLAALVPMLPVPGTTFTYAATLPVLAATATDLRYAIIARDAAGNMASSPEYVIPLKATTVVPGWQPESTSGTIKIVRENPSEPLEGFSDPSLTE